MPSLERGERDDDDRFGDGAHIRRCVRRECATQVCGAAQRRHRSYARLRTEGCECLEVEIQAVRARRVPRRVGVGEECLGSECHGPDLLRITLRLERAHAFHLLYISEL